MWPGLNHVAALRPNIGLPVAFARTGYFPNAVLAFAVSPNTEVISGNPLCDYMIADVFQFAVTARFVPFCVRPRWLPRLPPLDPGTCRQSNRISKRLQSPAVELFCPKAIFPVRSFPEVRPAELALKPSEVPPEHYFPSVPCWDTRGRWGPREGRDYGTRERWRRSSGLRAWGEFMCAAGRG